MNKDELLALYAKDIELMARGVTYLLHIGTNAVLGSSREEYQRALEYENTCYGKEIAVESELKVYDVARALAGLEPGDLLDFMAVAAGWASLEDIRPERGMQLKPDFTDTDEVRRALKENLEQQI